MRDEEFEETPPTNKKTSSVDPEESEPKLRFQENALPKTRSMYNTAGDPRLLHEERGIADYALTDEESDDGIEVRRNPDVHAKETSDEPGGRKLPTRRPA